MARPFCGEVAHARHAMAVREAPCDCGLDEIGGEEGKRDRHVDLPCAAALAHCDTLGFDSRVGHDLVEPAATLRNRCNQQRAVFRADGSDILGAPSFRYENFPAASRRCLSPWDFEHVMAVLLSLRIRGFGSCEFDEDLIWVDLRPDDMFVNENCVCNLGGDRLPPFRTEVCA